MCEGTDDQVFSRTVFSSHPFLALLPFPILRGLRVYQSLPRVGRGSIKLDSLLSSFDLICIFEFREPTERHQSSSTASISRDGLNPEQRPRPGSKVSIKRKRLILARLPQSHSMVSIQLNERIDSIFMAKPGTTA